MKAFQHSGKGFLGGLAVTVCVALAALTPMAAHAAPGHTPYITVNDGDWGPINPHVKVQGVGFIVNDPVLIEAVTAGGVVVARDVTIARAIPVARSLPTGTVAALLTVSAAYRGQVLRLFAIDEARGVRSNTIAFRLPWLPIPKCKPYTCL
jgi:hypothetical protein